MMLYKVPSRIVLGNRHTAIKTVNKSWHKTDTTFQIYVCTILCLFDDEFFLAFMSVAACTNAFI